MKEVDEALHLRLVCHELEQREPGARPHERGVQRAARGVQGHRL
jgi:hypothetical protein